MKNKVDDAIHEFLRACVQPYSVNIRRNIYVLFGLLFGLGTVALISLHHMVHGDMHGHAPSILDLVLGRWPDQLGLITPLLGAWVFGTMGTIRRDKEESRKRTIDLLEDEVHDRTQGLRDMYVQTVLALSAAIEAKHPYTFGHCQRVWEFASTIARRIGVPEDDMEVLRFACYLHDIGKIRIPDHVLDKPGGLTDEEFALIKLHTVHGDTILRPIAGFRRVAKLVRMHHEKEDGSGYPDRLTGDQIPLLGKILIVSDTLDAMVSDRPYREPLSMEAGLAELRRCSGLPFDAALIPGRRTASVRHFDPSVVMALEEALAATLPEKGTEGRHEDAVSTPHTDTTPEPTDRSLWATTTPIALHSCPAADGSEGAASSAEAPRQNCWEVMDCGHGPDQVKTTAGPRCPVPLASRFDGVNGGFAGGRVCWSVAGAMCQRGAASAPPGGADQCRSCSFMERVRREEGLARFRLVPHKTGTHG